MKSLPKYRIIKRSFRFCSREKRIRNMLDYIFEQIDLCNCTFILTGFRDMLEINSQRGYYEDAQSLTIIDIIPRVYLSYNRIRIEASIYNIDFDEYLFKLIIHSLNYIQSFNLDYANYANYAKMKYYFLTRNNNRMTISKKSSKEELQNDAQFVTENSPILTGTVNKYELTVITTASINIEDMTAFASAIDNPNIKISDITEIGRFDSCYKIGKLIKKNSKINVFLFIVDMPGSARKILDEIVRSEEKILRHIIVNVKNLNKNFDYKNPIDLHKHMFDTYRLHPRELTKFSREKQRDLAQSVKRAKTIAIVGYKSY